MAPETSDFEIASKHFMWDKLVKASLDHLVVMLPQSPIGGRWSGLSKPPRPGRIMQVYMEEPGGAKYNQRDMLVVPGVKIKVKLQMMNRPTRFEAYSGELIAGLMEE